MIQSDDVRKEGILWEDRECWEKLVLALDAHPSGSVSSPGTPVWTSRDVYAHMSRWMDFNVHAIGELVAGHRFPRLTKTTDEINNAWQIEDSHLTLAEARARAHNSYEKWMCTLEALPVTQLTGIIERVVRAGGTEHYREHLGYMGGK
jgi:hypothetical protein